MELIPILSTIILVATISTFLLAIGAYVLYKVRERRGQKAAAPQPSSVQAELVSPAEAPSQQPEAAKAIPQPIFVEQEPVRIQRQPVFVQQQYRTQAQSGPQRRKSSQPREFSGGYQPKGYEDFQRPVKEKTSDKYYKYTSEGYVTPQEDKRSGVLKWR